MTLSNTYLTGSITLCWFVLCPGLAAQSSYDAWLREDAAYIITEPERFIEQFWLHRDPTPETLRNEFKEEHYRRIAYAQRPLQLEHSRMDDGSRQDLYHVRSAR
jgi:hypothetical protein